MTIQQGVGLATAVTAAITTVLVADQSNGADIPSSIIIALGVASAGLGAANAFLGGIPSMARSMVRKIGSNPAHIEIDKAARP
jgi:hypothetical protein